MRNPFRRRKAQPTPDESDFSQAIGHVLRQYVRVTGSPLAEQRARKQWASVREDLAAGDRGEVEDLGSFEQHLPNRERTVHYRVGAGTACGSGQKTMNVTSEPSQVTCGGCHRTVRWKAAVRDIAT